MDSEGLELHVLWGHLTMPALVRVTSRTNDSVVKSNQCTFQKQGVGRWGGGATAQNSLCEFSDVS